jgi:hypothetical protein
LRWKPGLPIRSSRSRCMRCATIRRLARRNRASSAAVRASNPRSQPLMLHLLGAHGAPTVEIDIVLPCRDRCFRADGVEGFNRPARPRF